MPWHPSFAPAPRGAETSKMSQRVPPWRRRGTPPDGPLHGLRRSQTTVGVPKHTACVSVYATFVYGHKPPSDLRTCGRPPAPQPVENLRRVRGTPPHHLEGLAVSRPSARFEPDGCASAPKLRYLGIPRHGSSLMDARSRPSSGTSGRFTLGLHRDLRRRYYHSTFACTIETGQFPNSGGPVDPLTVGSHQMFDVG